MKKWWKVGILLGFLSLIYFVVRTYHLTEMPIFTDEAIYIRWSQIAKQDANWRFISLTDGKQPMYVWIAMILMKFISDPLMAGRMVSVLAGLVSMIGLFFLGREIFKSVRVGVLSSILYLIYPFALVYDRMAMYDTLVGTFTIWSLFIAFLLIRTVRLDVALIFGLVVGGGMLTKTNAFFSLLFPIFGLLFFDFTGKNVKYRLFKLAGLALVSTVLAFLCYSILRLSPFFHIISDKNNLFVYTLEEWWWLPNKYFSLWSNFRGLWDWFWNYMTIPWVVLVPIGLFIQKKHFREKVFLIFIFLVPFIYLTFFGKTIYPRFVLFMTLSLIPLVAYTLLELKDRIKNKKLGYLVFALFFVWPLYMDYFVLFNLKNAPLPRSDLRQYLLDWPAGGGVKESVEFFEKEASRGPIYLATQGTFGLMPFAYEIYLVQNPNIKIVGYWPLGDTVSQELLDQSKKMPTYIVFYQPCPGCSKAGLAPIGWERNLKIVQRYTRGLATGPRYLTVYQIISP